MPIIAEFFNLGTDFNIVATDNDTGQIIDWGGRVIDFDPKPKETLSESSGVQNYGMPNYRVTYGGWEIDVTVERTSANLETLRKEMESAWFSTGAQKYFTVQETCYNGPSNPPTVNVYTGAVFMMSTFGPRNKENRVEVKFTFHAQTIS